MQIIYVAKITDGAYYLEHFTKEVKAFKSLADAEQFMTENGFTFGRNGWVHTINPFDLEGIITTLELN
jgi:hypothetical protein